MAALANNLTQVKLQGDEPLLARYPTLNSYLPKDEVDWEGQRELAAIELQNTFWSYTGRDPAWCVAESKQQWLSMLADMALVVIFRAFTPHETWLKEAERWATIVEHKMKIFRYQEDSNRDGEIDSGEAEDVQTIRSIELLR